jgi:hypothetical protein
MRYDEREARRHDRWLDTQAETGSTSGLRQALIPGEAPVATASNQGSDSNSRK